MGLTNAEKVRALMNRRKVTIGEIAKLLNVSRQSVHNRLNKDTFSKEELEKIATHLDAVYESNFVLADGTKI